MGFPSSPGAPGPPQPEPRSSAWGVRSAASPQRKGAQGGGSVVPIAHPANEWVQRGGSVVPITHPVKGWAGLALRAELPPDSVAARYRWVEEARRRLDGRSWGRLGAVPRAASQRTVCSRPSGSLWTPRRPRDATREGVPERLGLTLRLPRLAVTCCDGVRRQLRAERQTSPPLHGVGDRYHRSTPLDPLARRAGHRPHSLLAPPSPGVWTQALLPRPPYDPTTLRPYDPPPTQERRHQRPRVYSTDLGC
jgi:hypothetical protein